MKTIITLVFLVWTVYLFSQTNFIRNSSDEVINGAQIGYYIASGKVVKGIKIMKTTENERAHEIIIPNQINHKFRQFHPTDIAGYGFEESGRKFYSNTIYLDGKVKTVFLEELIKGKDNITFYIYYSDKGKLYFVQRGKQTAQLITDIEVVRSYLRNKAEECSSIKEIDRYPMKVNRTSILRMYEAYMNNNLNVLPRLRYGVGPTLDICLSGEKGLFMKEYKNSVSSCLFGVAYGVGTELKITNEVSLYAGLRYNFSASFNDKESHHVFGINLAIGF